MTTELPPPQPEARLDLRGTPCPVNFIRSKLALERISAGSWLQVDLDAGEPERMVVQGLRAEGHRVEVQPLEEGGVRLLIGRHGG